MIRWVDDVDCRIGFTLAGDTQTARVTRQTSDPLNNVRQHPRNEIRRSFFSVRVADTWNSLPSEMKHCALVNAFKKKVSELFKNLFYLMLGSGFDDENQGARPEYQQVHSHQREICLQVLNRGFGISHNKYIPSK